MSVKGKDIADTFFTNVSPNNYRCILCNHNYKVKGSGHTNLKSHVQSKHKEAYDDFEKASTNGTTLDMSKYRYPTKTLRTHAWVEYIVMTLAPFSAVQCKYTRKNFKYDPVSLNTLHKYMEKLIMVVEKEITDLLPSKFGLVFDGWSSGGTHHVGLFATFPVSNENCDLKYNRVLLSFSPLLDEQHLDANEHVEFVKFHLGVFKKSTGNVVSLTGDNCNLNKSISNALNIPLVGCASNRFNLAVPDILKDYEELISKVHNLMKKLSTPKMLAKLRNHTHLRPLRHNSTRWSSVFFMIKRFCDLREVLPKLGSETIDDLTPNNTQCRKIEAVLTKLSDLESVTKVLQDDSISISDVKHLFEEVVTSFESTNDKLRPDADIILNPEFESAIAKIQDNKESTLSSLENISVENLKAEAETNRQINQSEENLSIVERSRKRRRLSLNCNGVKYIDLSFIVPTSNICERLFSIAGFALTDRRQSISPARFEGQIFLHVNSSLWSVTDVHEIIRENPDIERLAGREIQSTLV